MIFTGKFIDSLINQEEIKCAKLLNNFKITPSKNDADNSELMAMEKAIVKLANKSKISPLLEKLEQDGKSYKFILKNVFDTSVEDLDEMIKTLEALSSSKVKSLVAKLKAFKILLESYEIKYRPKGLYGFLTGVNALCSSSMAHSPSFPFQHALLTGVVQPVVALFEELEQKGDLTITSLPMLDYAKAKMLEALTRFSKVQDEALQKELEKYDSDKNEWIAEKTAQQNALTMSLVEKLEKLRQTAQSLELTPLQKENIEKEIQEIDKQIKSVDIKKIQESIDKYFKNKKVTLIKQRGSEKKELKMFFNLANEELAYIRKCICALDGKKKINEKYKDATNKSEMKKRTKEIKALKSQTGQYYLLSDNHASKAFINKHGGRLLYNLSQGKLAAMGHSEGLCGGYSAEFLEKCSTQSWDALTFNQKMSMFKPILVNKQSVNLDRSANVFNNDLSMTLESALRWDIQSAGEYKRGATLFEIKSDDKTHATHKRKSKNAKAFYQRYVNGIMAQLQSRDSARLMLWFFDKEQGHAVGLNHDKDGFLFHDSNTGYIHFADENKFATFLVDYLYLNYPELTDNASVLDYDVVRKNISKYNLEPKFVNSLQQADFDELLSIEKQQSQLLERMNTLKLKVDSLKGSLKLMPQAPAPKGDLNPPVQDVVSANPKQKSLIFSAITEPSPQQQKLKHLAVHQGLRALLQQYMENYDQRLNEQPVLKQRVFHEIKMLENELSTQRVEALRKLAQQHNLANCEALIGKMALNPFSNLDVKQGGFAP